MQKSGLLKIGLIVLGTGLTISCSGAKVYDDTEKKGDEIEGEQENADPNEEVGFSLLSEFDELQKIFIDLSYETTIEDVEEMIKDNDFCFTVQEYNSSLKSQGKVTKYKIAYTEKVAKQKYADDGDHVEVEFDNDGGIFLYAEYFNLKGFETALLYNYGIYWDFNQKEPNNKYSGYYYNKPGETKGGIVFEYENGSVETGYHPCNSAEEAISHAVFGK